MSGKVLIILLFIFNGMLWTTCIKSRLCEKLCFIMVQDCKITQPYVQFLTQIRRKRSSKLQSNPCHLWLVDVILAANTRLVCWFSKGHIVIALNNIMAHCRISSYHAGLMLQANQATSPQHCFISLSESVLKDVLN